jgi:hypothetical protein
MPASLRWAGNARWCALRQHCDPCGLVRCACAATGGQPSSPRQRPPPVPSVLRSAGHQYAGAFRHHDLDHIDTAIRGARLALCASASDRPCITGGVAACRQELLCHAGGHLAGSDNVRQIEAPA